MKPILKTILFVSFLTILSVGVFPVAAQIGNVDGSAVGIAPGVGATTCTLGAYLMGFINLGLALVGIVAVIFIIYAGIKLIIARGDEKEAETAKMTILYAVIGLVIIGLAAAIVNTVLGGINGGQIFC
jgi:hypothetical protein